MKWFCKTPYWRPYLYNRLIPGKYGLDLHKGFDSYLCSLLDRDEGPWRTSLLKNGSLFAGVRNIPDHSTNGLRNILGLQKETKVHTLTHIFSFDSQIAQDNLYQSPHLLTISWLLCTDADECSSIRIKVSKSWKYYLWSITSHVTLN